MASKHLPLIGTAVLVALVAVLWAFPRLWYNRSDSSLEPVWLSERTNLVGWTYTAIPVSESAERLLVADRMVSGEFRQSEAPQIVRVFSAKRYTSKPHDIGLFVHTPDRCWTQGGWEFEPITPDSVGVTIHGIAMVFERRLFIAGGQRELVYFGGLVGGQPLPYRLDHNMSVGMKFALNKAAKERGAMGAGLRVSDKLFWQRVWEAFRARRQILGPKQFIRISTPVLGSELKASDELLRSFLNSWLFLEDYQKEIQSWRAQRS